MNLPLPLLVRHTKLNNVTHRCYIKTVNPRCQETPQEVCTSLHTWRSSSTCWCWCRVTVFGTLFTIIDDKSSHLYFGSVEFISSQSTLKSSSVSSCRLGRRVQHHAWWFWVREGTRPQLCSEDVFAYPKFVHFERVDALSQNQNQTDEEALYDKSLLEARVQELKAARDTGDFHKLLFVVRSDLLRNVGNKCNRWSPHHDLQQVSLLCFAMLCDEKHRPAHGMIWSDLIWSDLIWCDTIWYDMIWYDMIFYVSSAALFSLRVVTTADLHRLHSHLF